MTARLAVAAIGVVFGFVLAWSGMADPDVIRQGLLLESFYLYGLFATALATAAIGLRVLRALGARALLTGEPVTWTTARPERRHVVGSLLFGAGWGVSAACPGPIAAQAGGGALWSLAVLAGVVVGIRMQLARHRDAAGVVVTEPA
ncbi:MAG TPA: DUF6691 family protein [Gaiellaceae bacterium]|nr:DUF6691 family protein [Gaiellaceae bacterium]